MIIQVQIKDVYGKKLVYPITSQEDLKTLTGSKTLTNRHLQALKNLGFTFEIIADKIEL